jgi:sporulation protein YlmC with PRC-barrel domain
MNNKRWMCALLVPVLGWTAVAQTERPQEQPKPAQQPKATQQPKEAMKAMPFCHKASDVIGSDVKNAAGEDLGNVEDIVVDPNSGMIEYAVLSSGGFLGIGDKLFTVPFGMLKAPMVKEGSELAYFTLDVDKAKLENAPRFPKDQWPNVDEPSWRAEIDTYFGTSARTTGEKIDAAQRFHLVRASELLGEDVNNPNDDDLGDVKEIVVDPQRSRVTYFVLSSGGFLGLGDKLFAIPWEELDVVRKDKDDVRLVLDIDKARLEKSPEYRDAEWARMSDPAYVKSVYDYYDCHCYWVGPEKAGGSD